MPDRDEVLKEFTYKGQTETTQQRVYYTLMPRSGGWGTGDLTPRDVELWLHKVTKALSGVITHLAEDGRLSEQQLDDLLLRAVE